MMTGSFPRHLMKPMIWALQGLEYRAVEKQDWGFIFDQLLSYAIRLDLRKMFWISHNHVLNEFRRLRLYGLASVTTPHSRFASCLCCYAVTEERTEKASNQIFDLRLNPKNLELCTLLRASVPRNLILKYFFYIIQPQLFHLTLQSEPSLAAWTI